MVKILLADDEDAIRDLLPKKINSSNRGYSVVAVAENGKEALEKIKIHKPHILLTDICIPVLSGLELAKEAVKLDGTIKTIIISRYDNFSYAKSAMSLGIRDYLLKPFSPDDLFSVLDKITSEIESHIKLDAEIKAREKYFEENLLYLQDRFLRRLLSCEKKGTDFYKSAEIVKIDLSGCYYLAGLIRFICDEDLLIEEALEHIYSVKEELFGPALKCYVTMGEESPQSIFFSGDFSDIDTFIIAIKNGIEEINYELKERFGINISCISGETCKTLFDIGASYQEAVKLWQSSLETDPPLVFYTPALLRKYRCQPVRPRDLEERILVVIEMGDAGTALEIFDAILKSYSELMQNGYDNYVFIMLVELILNISNMIEKHGGNPEIWKNDELLNLLKKNLSMGSLIDISDSIKEYIAGSCKVINASSKNQGTKIVNTVKELIEKNLGDKDFCVETVSERIYFSASYIRQLFRRISGESFMGYLIKRRMETAGKLILIPEYKIQDVAEYTGYSNQRYFSICFKKYYNCTPSEYRKKMGVPC